MAESQSVRSDESGRLSGQQETGQEACPTWRTYAHGRAGRKPAALNLQRPQPKAAVSWAKAPAPLECRCGRVEQPSVLRTWCAPEERRDESRRCRHECLRHVAEAGFSCI